MKKQKMKLRLKHTGGAKTPLATKKQQLAGQLKDLASKRAKLTDDLRTINNNMMGAQSLQQAGMLAHYALLAVILGNFLKGVQKAYIEKQLESFGNKEMGYNEKLEQFGLFEKNIKDISELSKKIDGLDEEQKPAFAPKMEELSQISDAIAQKLGLNSEEYSALTASFTSHTSKLSANKEISASPFENTPNTKKKEIKIS